MAHPQDERAGAKIRSEPAANLRDGRARGINSSGDSNSDLIQLSIFMKIKTPIRQLRKVIPISNLERELSSTKIDIDRILYLKSDSSYTMIHLNDGTKIISINTLKRFNKQLPAEKFMRVHPNYMIRKSSLSCYLANQNKIILHNAQEIPVSNSNKEGILNYLKTLMS